MVSGRRLAGERAEPASFRGALSQDSTSLVGYCPYALVSAILARMRCKAGVKTLEGLRPCGMCMACRINKGRIWTSRILMETVTRTDYSWFVTLTYNQAAVPITLDDDGAPVTTLRKQAFRKWLNNQSRDLGPFRYFAVGEYGDAGGRAHYHLACFPENVAQISALADNWRRRQGFVQVTEINPSRARYLARYTAKKLTSAGDDRLCGNQEPEFSIASRSPPLGAQFADDLIRHYKTNKAARQLVKERGDVERSWRYDGKVYPIAGWPLKRIREGLGIPLLHRDRAAANARYLEYHDVQEAESCPKQHKAQQEQIRAKTKATFHRGQAAKL